MTHAETSKTSPRESTAGSDRTRLIILGSGGGPAIHNNPVRLGPAAVVTVDGHPYLIDCGEGAPRQFLRTGHRLEAVDHVFVTHHHFDHNSDLGNFLVYAWFAGRVDPVDVWGPPPLAQILRDFTRMHEFDFKLREVETGYPAFAPVPRAHELALEGEILERGVHVMTDDRISVSAYRVVHGTVPTIALRIGTPAGDIVFSGDRGTGGDDLVGFAEGANVLVHEVLHLETMRQLYAGAPPVVFEHFRHSHTSPEDVGRAATAAGVKTVVLNHVLPDAESPTAAEWVAMVAGHFDGRILVGTDLLEVPL